MNRKELDKLVKSIKQAGRIGRGESGPSRVFEIRPVDIKITQKVAANSSSKPE